jgi:HK97 family phage portal protein
MGFFSGLFGGNKSTDAFTQPIIIDNTNYQSVISGILNAYTADNNEIKDYVTTSEMKENKLFETTPELNIVINKGASLFSNGSWKMFDLNGEEIEQHQVLDLLKKPNVFQNKNEFLQHSYLFYSIYGNSIIFANKATKESLPAQLNLLQPPLVRVVKSNKYYRQLKLKNMIDRYELFENRNGREQVLDRFEVDEIIHIKNNNPDDFFMGKSPLIAIHMPITNIRLARGYVNADYSKKGAMGGLFPEIQKDAGGALPVAQKDIDELEKLYSEHTHGTADAQNKVIIAKKPMKFVPFSSAIKDHMIFETLDKEFKVIIDHFGLNQSVFSFMQQSTFSNQANGEKQAYENGVIPIANKLSSEINSKLNLVEKFGMYVKLDYSHLECFASNEKEDAEILENKVKVISDLMAIGYSKEEAVALVGI